MSPAHPEAGVHFIGDGTMGGPKRRVAPSNGKVAGLREPLCYKRNAGRRNQRIWVFIEISAANQLKVLERERKKRLGKLPYTGVKCHCTRQKCLRSLGQPGGVCPQGAVRSTSQGYKGLWISQRYSTECIRQAQNA